MRYAVMIGNLIRDVADGRASFDELIPALAESGIDGLDPALAPFGDEQHLLDEFRRLAEQNDLPLPCTGVACDLVHADPAERRRAGEGLRRDIERVASLGSPIALVIGHAPKEDVPLDAARGMIADGLAAQADFAESASVTLAFEDFGRYSDLICRGRDCLDVLRRTDPRVRFVFDTGNFYYAFEGVEENLPLLLDRTCHVHVKDQRITENPPIHPGTRAGALRACPLGEGMVANRAAAGAFRTAGYSGWVSLEISPQLPDPGEVIRRDLPAARVWWEQC